MTRGQPFVTFAKPLCPLCVQIRSGRVAVTTRLDIHDTIRFSVRALARTVLSSSFSLLPFYAPLLEKERGERIVL